MKIKDLLPLLAGLALAGCSAAPSGGAASTAAGSTAAAESKGGDFKVALLTPGPVSDAGWSALAYDGLQKVKTELGATVDNQEATGDNIQPAMKAYAQKGYKLIFGHGFEYNDAAIKVAKDFPDTDFVSSSGGETAPNVGAFRFYLEQGCYLAGMMAAKMSKTGVIGSVAVKNYPSIVSTLKAYEAGAKAARPDIKIVPTVYFGAEGDVAGAKRATESVLDQKADFVIHQANAAAQGVFDACKERGAYAFGTNADQNGNPSGIVIASATIVAGPAFLDLAKQVKEGTFKGSIVLKGMEDGSIDFVVNPALQSKVPPDVLKTIEDVKANIKAGHLTVPKDNF